MSGLRRLLVAALAALCLTALAATGASAAITVYPDSMAVTGASATRAALTCETRDCSANSWATGTNPAVNSIYLRIRAVHPAIEGRVWNDAVGGENMSDLRDQIEVTIEHRAAFVIVDMGGNDICAPNEAGVTSPESFRSDFEGAMSLLLERRPNTRIAVVSIPSMYHLWDLFDRDARATEVWNRNGTCASMLANPTSTLRADVERRTRVNAREIVLNNVLGTVCARYANCRYDGGAAFEYPFAATDLGRDYFHPSIAGQTTAAAAMWELPWEF